MASCVRNICTKNYQNLIIGFKVTVENVGDVFWDTVYNNDFRNNNESPLNIIRIIILYFHL